MAAECIGAKEDAHEADDAPEDEFEVTLESLLAAAPGFAQRVTLALCLSNASDAVETLSLGFALPFLSWDWQGLVAASVFLGMLAGGCLAGYLTETYGPKRLLVQMLYLEAVAALATSGVGGPWQLAGGRFVSGLAIGAAVPPIFGLAEELLFPRQRRLRSLSLIASSFIFGSLLVSLLAWLCLANNLGWRVFYACTGVVPMLNAALVSSWVPESPSFLQRQGRRAELVLELRRLAPNGAFDVAGMAGGAFKVAQEANHLPSEEVPGLKPLLQWPLRPVALRLGTICFSIAFAWYGLSTWLLKLFEEVGLEHRYLAAVAYALSGVPGCVASVLLLRCLQPWRLLASHRVRSTRAFAGGRLRVFFQQRLHWGLQRLDHCVGCAFQPLSATLRPGSALCGAARGLYLRSVRG
ncbi:unnamed protein product [Effrenium voratum]|uniref:Major facilitator superfamily (MFS) profile domain-containing protein n=1 Tax=Effrenium voratum TaxID=2562239 RepID=A0AA36HVG3_9DINO|nr:unnamed protein product [Effrenium voratum]